MKKKIKLGLDDLKVNSFVTSLHDSESGEIKGGTQLSCNQECQTYEFQTCIETRDAPCRVTFPAMICAIMSVNGNCAQTFYEGC